MEPDATGILSDNSSSPKTQRRRKGKVWWALWEKTPFGKENKAPKNLSKDGGHEDDQFSHIISSNETNMPIEPVKPESEPLFIQPTPKSWTSGIDDSKLSSSSRPLLRRREAQVWHLEEGAADGKENKSLDHLCKDDEDANKQLNHQDNEYISSNETNMAIEPGTPPLWFLWERLVQTVLGAENKPFEEHLSKDGEHEGEHENEQALKFPYKEGGDKDGQFRMDDESDDDDEPLESDDENSTQDDWLGNADQIADLILVLRWSRSYRVSIEAAGKVLNKKPGIVKRALKIRAQPDKEEALLLENKPVIGKWWKLGPI